MRVRGLTWRAAPAIVISASMFHPCTTHAEPEPFERAPLARGGAAAPDAGLRRCVTKVIAPARDSGLESALQEPLERLKVSLSITVEPGLDLTHVLEPDPEAAAADARVWIDLRQPARATLYIVDSPWERVLVRHLPTPHGLDEVAREQIAAIVSSSVEGLLSGERIGVSREEARSELGLPPETPAPPREAPIVREPVPLPPPVAPRPALSPPATVPSAVLSVEGRARAELWSADRVRPEFELGGVVTAAPRGTRARPLAHVAVSYLPPARLGLSPVDVSASGGRARAAVGGLVPVGSRFELRAETGALIEAERLSPRVTDDAELEPAPVRSRLRAGPTAEVALATALARPISLVLGGSIAAVWPRPRFSVLRASGDDIVGEPWSVRPSLFAGLSGRIP